MLDVHLFSSKQMKTVIILSLAATFLGGCSTSSLEKNMYVATDKSIYNSDKKSRVTKNKEDIKANKIGLQLNKKSTNAVRTFGIDPEKLSGVRNIQASATCRYLQSSAESEAIIVASPTASASSDEDGSGSVSLGMNLLDFRKADLIRASADAKCRLHEASKKIEATLGLGVEATRFAHANAKQAHIRNQLGQMRRIERKAGALMQQGAITVQDRNLVSQRINELKSEMERFAAEASRRKDLPSLDINQIKSRHGALVEASNDLQAIEREIRSNDAFEFSVSTGYRYNEQFNNDLQKRENDGAFANVTVGVRLGALSKARHRYEEEASAAKLDSLFEKNSGTVWKSGFSKRATDRMIVDLKKSEQQLLSAQRDSKDTIAKLANADRPEIIRTRLTSKIENIRVSANLAGVRASIKQLQENSKKIGALSR